MIKYIFLGFMALSFSNCKQQQGDINSEPEKTSVAISGVSLDGKSFQPLPRSDSIQLHRDSMLALAIDNYRNNADDLENIIWLGRRLAYVDQYYEAIRMFTEAIEKHPESPEPYRHRGHRYITTRRFDLAVEDLSKAAELAEGMPMKIEQDGLPNAQNIPLSNLHFNIYYHLGLAHYLKQNFDQAITAWEKCMEYSDNPDLRVATSDWLYLSYSRNNQEDEASEILAAIPDDLEIIENDGYYKRLKMYKGIIDSSELLDLSNDKADKLQLVTQGYGVAVHHLINGETTTYLDILNQILETGYWPAFGYIAAEADLYYPSED